VQKGQNMEAEKTLEELKKEIKDTIDKIPMQSRAVPAIKAKIQAYNSILDFIKEKENEQRT
jgi:hypothetical protein